MAFAEPRKTDVRYRVRPRGHGKNVMVVKFSREEASDLAGKKKITGTQVTCWTAIVRKHR
jgi:hypothetical protein